MSACYARDGTQLICPDFRDTRIYYDLSIPKLNFSIFPPSFLLCIHSELGQDSLSPRVLNAAPLSINPGIDHLSVIDHNSIPPSPVPGRPADALAELSTAVGGEELDKHPIVSERSVAPTLLGGASSHKEFN